MHRIVKKTIKYAGYIFLLLIIGLIVGISYLYFSADMMQPKHEPMIPLREMPYTDTIIMAPAEVIYNDTLDLRFYADNFLRHSESGLWELFVRGMLLKGGMPSANCLPICSIIRRKYLSTRFAKLFLRTVI